MSPSEKSKKKIVNDQQYPKVPSDFECFVCGKKLVQYERIQHLKKMPTEVCTILPHLRKDRH